MPAHAVAQVRALPMGLAVLVSVLVLGALAVAYWPRPQVVGGLDEYVFVASGARPQVALVSIRDSKVAGRMAVPAAADHLLVSPQIDRIVTAHRAARQLVVTDIASPEAQSVLPLPLDPVTVTLSPDGETVAAADPGSGKVVLVGLGDLSLRLIAPMADARAISFSADSGYLFVPDARSGLVQVIDVISSALLDGIATSLGGGEGALTALARTPDGRYGVTVDTATGRASVIDFRTWKEVSALRFGSAAARPYMTADGRYMLVASEGDGQLHVVDTRGFKTVAMIAVGGGVTSLSSGNFERTAIVTRGGDRRVALIDLEDMTVAADFALDGTPGPAVVDADGKLMYVALRETGRLVVLDIGNRKIVSVAGGVGAEPSLVALARSNNVCF